MTDKRTAFVAKLVRRYGTRRGGPVAAGLAAIRLAQSSHDPNAEGATLEGADDPAWKSKPKSKSAVAMPIWAKRG